MQDTAGFYEQVLDKNYVPRYQQSLARIVEELRVDARTTDADSADGLAFLSRLENLAKHLDGYGSNPLPSTTPLMAQWRREYGSLGEAIADFRKQNCISQVQLSRMAGISHRTVYRVEKGIEARPSDRMIRRILLTFSIDDKQKMDELVRNYCQD